jgi:general secretion pathway protein L
MSALGRFLRWWGAGLAAPLPAAAGGLLAGSRGLLLAQPLADGVRLEAHGVRGLGGLGRLDALPEARRRRFVRAARGGRLAVALAIPAERAVERRVTLPLAAEADLDAVLRYEIDRLTPFSADEVFFRPRVAARRPLQGEIEVDIAFAPRAAFASALAALDAAGLPATQVVLVDGSGVPAGPPLTAPGLAAAPRAPLGARLAAVGVCLLLALAFAWAVADQWARSHALATLRAEVAALRAEALAAAPGAAPDDAAEAARRALALRAARPMAAAALAALSETLPDDAWLTSLRLDAEGVVIAGFAADAVALVPTLDADPAFGPPRFLAPVTRDDAIERERFTLGLPLAEGAP